MKIQKNNIWSCYISSFYIANAYSNWYWLNWKAYIVHGTLTDNNGNTTLVSSIYRTPDIEANIHGIEQDLVNIYNEKPESRAAGIHYEKCIINKYIEGGDI